MNNCGNEAATNTKHCDCTSPYRIPGPRLRAKPTTIIGRLKSYSYRKNVVKDKKNLTFHTGAYIYNYCLNNFYSAQGTILI